MEEFDNESKAPDAAQEKTAKEETEVLQEKRKISVDDERLKSILEEEMQLFQERTEASLDLARWAVNYMPMGVPTNVTALDPYPFAIEYGHGAYIWDEDDNKYIDYSNGFGATLYGHSNQEITRSLEEQAKRGTHFGALTKASVHWAEEICQRQNLNWVRFSNSGTEATMDAIRLARAKTGREKIAKIEGGYHGSHPEAFVSGNMPLDGTEGPDSNPNSRAWSDGITKSTIEDVLVLPFNDLLAAKKMLQENEIACILMEPILFNVGAIFPEPGYLEGVRELCDETGTLLIFDETKTGITIAYGGAEEYFGVAPDLKTLGKGIGGGVPCGAFGGKDEWGFEKIEDWSVPHLGTFSGNPLAASAGSVALGEVLTREAYEVLETHRKYLTKELERIIEKYDLPAYVVGAGAKGCLVWSEKKLKNFRDYARDFHGELASLTWIFLINRGIFLAPGHDEQWTHSISHTKTEADYFVKCFEELAKKINEVT